jgi:hypothetical protein
MVYQGTVRNGKIELANGNSLPDGTIVRVEPLENSDDPADGLGDEAASTGITDLASQHDHYIYGDRKREA